MSESFEWEVMKSGNGHMTCFGKKGGKSPADALGYTVAREGASIEDCEARAKRIVLEHNVFRSMSDESIKELATNMVPYYALRADLDEAQKALLKIRSIYPDKPKLPMTWQIKEVVDNYFLAKHKEGK